MEVAKSSLIDSNEDQREDATLNFNQNPENANQIPIKIFHLNTISKSRKERVECQTVKVKRFPRRIFQFSVDSNEHQADDATRNLN